MRTVTNGSSHRMVILLAVIAAGCQDRSGVVERLTQQQKAQAEKAVLAPAPVDTDAFRQAAARGDARMVEKFLSEGVDTDAFDEDGRTSLQLAAFDGHSDVVGLLLARGAAVDHRDGFGRTALMYASTGPHAATVQLLLEAGASSNLVDNQEEFTALMFAAAEGQVDVVKLLLAAGADASLKDVDGDTARSFAEQNGHAEVVELLPQ